MPKYDEVNSYLPRYYADISEVQAYLRALGTQLDALYADQQIMRDNNFIWLADEATISRIEAFLYITYDGSRTLYERKQMIVSYFTGHGHIGATEIKDIVGVFTPSPCEVVFANSTIDLRITRDVGDTFILADCYFTLKRKIPAHLNLIITVISPFDVPAYVGVAVSEYKEEVI